VAVLYKNKLMGRNGTSIKGNKISSRVQKWKESRLMH
jgi:hypothetical protein